MRPRTVFGWPCVVAAACVLLAAGFASADLVHRYSFTADATDSVGGANGTAYGNVTYADGQATLNNDGSQNSNSQGVSPPADPPGAYIDLPNGIISALGVNATFEGWVTWNGPSDSGWQRIFDFGTSDSGENSSGGAGSSSYVMMTARTSWGVYGSGYRYGPTANERAVYNRNGQPLAVGVQQHVALAWDSVHTQATLYLNGQAVEYNMTHFNLTDLSDVNNWLGRAQWPDAMYSGSFNEFRIYNEVLSAGQIRKNGIDGPDAAFTRVSVTASQLKAAPVHRYSFNGDANDSIGTANGTLYNTTGYSYYENGVLTLGNDGTQSSADGTGDYVDLPNGIITALGESATFEAWYTWNDPAYGYWQRVFDFGTSDAGEDLSTGAENSTYMMVAPRAAGDDDGRLRFGFRDGLNAAGGQKERWIDATDSLEPYVETHVVVTWDGEADETAMYVNGELVTIGPTHFDLSAMSDVNNWLGRSQWDDTMSMASYNEFRIYDYALSAEEVLGNYEAGAETLNVSPVEYHPGDANLDGKVDDLDASILAANWQRTGDASWATADFNNDGDVNDLDASILAANWQYGVGSAVPEPGTLVLLAGLALLGLALRRK